MTEEKRNSPKPMDLLTDMPEGLGSYLRSRGVVTCEQAYEQIVRLQRRGSAQTLPEGVTAEDIVRLRVRLEAMLSEDERARLLDSGRVRWTEIRPLGVLPIDRLNESPDMKPRGKNQAHSGAANDERETGDE